MSLRLLVEKPTENLLERYEYVTEETNSKSPASLYINGPYMMAEEVNRNKRIYTIDDMDREVSRYVTEMIKTGRAMGELNHPTSAEVNPERACHMVVGLQREGNVFNGKSKVLTTPVGEVVRCLINDGVRLGMSSRALGQLVQEENDINRVKEMRLIAIDCVADPSYPKAFVNGILESASFVINKDGRYEQLYDSFKTSIATLPKHETDAYLRTQILNFIARL